MDYGEQTTGTRDEHYNLVSVLYHALNGADTCNRYALDAEAAGDERLAAGTPAYAHGMTNRPDHLLHNVMDILERERS